MRALILAIVACILAASAADAQTRRFTGLRYHDAADIATLKIDGTEVTSTAAELNILDGVTATAAELNVTDGVTAGTVTASKAVVVDANKDAASFRAVTVGSLRVTSGSALSAADVNLAKASIQAASIWAVDVSSNAVDVDFADDAAMDAADIGSRKTFVVATGHATQALTVTAGASGVTTVVTINTLGTSCEDAGDMIECVITSTSTATCITYCADS